jgi:signal transduction histidine kinase
VPVAVKVEDECSLPPDVKVVFYRIAQEALNNVAKHAAANQATVSLRCEGGKVVLDVLDDGRGFDPADVPPKTLGVGIMRDRADSIGAALQIESKIGQGTRVTASWMMKDN